MKLRSAVAALGLAIVLACALAPASQARGSRILPLDHWAYDGIRLLRTAGYLDALNPLVQPYRRDEVAAGLRDLDPATLPRGLDHWARLLREEFAAELNDPSGDAPRWGAWVSGGATGATSGREDPLRPVGKEDGWLFARGGGWVEHGPLSGEVVVRTDQYLDQDPDGIDPQHRFARTETGYLAADASYGGVFAGRAARNWSRLGTTSVFLSPVATTYPQIAFDIRAGRFTVRSVLGELDTVDVKKRYFAAHRVDVAWPDLVLSLGESVLLAEDGGGLPLRHLSPVEVLFFDTEAPPYDVVQNLMLQAAIWTRRGATELYGEWLLDDVDIAPAKGADREPTSYAFAMGARRTFGGPVEAVGVEYRQVSAWAYRTPNVVDPYSYLERGLGEAISDFDRVTLTADVFPPVAGLRLTPALILQRRGEGSFLAAVPPEAEYLAGPNIFLGVKETTRRAALRGRWQPRREAWAEWDLGVNRVTNVGHVEGKDETSFEGTARVAFRFNVVPWEALLR